MVLFICRDNVVHSILAEVLLKRWGDADFGVFSAGIRPRAAIDPRAGASKGRARLALGPASQELSGSFPAGRSPDGFRNNPRPPGSRLRTETTARESANVSLAHHESR